jgi:hypothetical protein
MFFVEIENLGVLPNRDWNQCLSLCDLKCHCLGFNSFIGESDDIECQFLLNQMHSLFIHCKLFPKEFIAFNEIRHTFFGDHQKLKSDAVLKLLVQDVFFKSNGTGIEKRSECIDRFELLE